MNTENKPTPAAVSAITTAIKVLDPGSPWGTISGILDQVEICESVIAKTRHDHPEHNAAIWNSFKLLMPSPLLREAPEPVYRAHCTELLSRVIANQDTTLGTKAEIMMSLFESSLRSPLTHTASVLYARLFREILPRTPVAEKIIAQLSTMAHDSATGSLLADLARSVRVTGRRPRKATEWYTPPE